MMPRKILKARAKKPVKLPGLYVASNPLIMETIFKYLDDKNLLNMRLVTTLWRTLATKTLMEDHSLKISIESPLDFPEIEKLITTGRFPAVVHEWNLEGLVNPLSDTMKKLGKEQEQYSTYLLQVVTQLTSRITKFAKGFGVRFANNSSPTEAEIASESTILNILFREYAHVGKLHLDDLCQMSNEVAPKVRTLPLLNVKQLKLSASPNPDDGAEKIAFWKHIILSSPNVKILDLNFCGLTEIQFFIECGKAARVTRFDGWDYVENEDLELVKNFVQYRPLLRNIDIYESDIDELSEQEIELRTLAKEVFRTSCTNSSSSLEWLTVPDLNILVCNDLSATENTGFVPVFNKLKFLKLKNTRWCTSKSYKNTKTCILPPSLSPAVSFPHLTEVKLSFGKGCVEQNLKFSSQSELKCDQLLQFSTVKKLKIKCAYGKNDLEILSLRFPCVEDLTFVQEVGFGKTVRLPKEFGYYLPYSLESLTLVYFVPYNHRQAQKIFSNFLTDLGRSELELLKTDHDSRTRSSTPARKNERNTRSSVKALKNRRIVFNVAQFMRERQRHLDINAPGPHSRKYLAGLVAGRPWYF